MVLVTWGLEQGLPCESPFLILTNKIFYQSFGRNLYHGIKLLDTPIF